MSGVDNIFYILTASRKKGASAQCGGGDKYKWNKVKHLNSYVGIHSYNVCIYYTHIYM